MECCKGKTKISPTANRNKLKVKTNELPKARENACDRVAIGVSFGSDWWRKWREFSGPITWQSIGESKEFVISFDN